MAFAAVFVAIAGYGVYSSQKAVNMSELALSNVEALAANPEILIAFCIDTDYVCNGVGIEDVDGYRQY